MKILGGFLIRLASLALFVWVIFGIIFGITPMANADMQPAVCAGDLMLYYRLDREPKEGDVVVFVKADRQYTGRVVAESGDTVEITEGSELRVNGSVVAENNIFYSTPRYESEVEYPTALADGQYFILCDSREGAKDSRSFGEIRKEEIKGKVITIIRRSGI